ncbi:histidine phosphatase family protein [Vibrio maritimus]|uniref:histidine phosphatase family protein n=1 Tax=Vibrio maritimus TaxID=990268 RepID=UPI0037354C63
MSADKSLAITRIALLRHGITYGETCFRGSTEFSLTQVGLQQMRNATESMSGIDHVISSPLSRCHQFATEFASRCGIELSINEDFRELDFGDWDGKEKQLVWNEEQDQLSAFWNDPWHSTPPNGETLKAFDRRVQSAWHKTIRQHQGQSLLVVTHGGVIKQILRSLLEMPRNAFYLQRLNIPFAALVHVSIYQDEAGHLWPEILFPGFVDKIIPRG